MTPLMCCENRYFDPFPLRTMSRKALMHAGIVGEFGMERRSHHFSLAHGHRIVALGGHHFTPGPTRSILGARMNTISIGASRF